MGLIGVVAGGVVTGAVQVIQTWQDRHLKRKVAARLIYADLMVASNWVHWTLKERRWPEDPGFDGMRTRWYAHREAFAAAVSGTHWNTVAGAYEYLAVMARQWGKAKALDDGDEQVLQQHATMIDGAAEIAFTRSASRLERRRMPSGMKPPTLAS